MTIDFARRATPDGESSDSAAGALLAVGTRLDMRPHLLRLQGLSRRSRHDALRLRLASWAFTTRRVPQDAVSVILPPEGRPVAGDLVLARVDAIGHHATLQLANGRRRQLYPGTEVVAAYGNRYAPNQFEAEVPTSMAPCHLVASGGIAARARSWHEKIARGPTGITPIGLLADADANRINLRNFTLDPVVPSREYQPTTIAVVGTSMDSGKTTTCLHLVRGLIAGGLRVGYAKVTGTGACGDYYALRDAGADPVLDFTDVGRPSTYLLSLEEVEHTMVSLVNHVTHSGVDAMVLEIADGVLQRETAELLSGSTFPQLVGGIVLAAQDSMGALAGFHWLRERRTPVLAVSGLLTAAPLQVVETRQATGMPVYDRDSLATASVAMDLLAQAQQHAEVPSSTVIEVA
ncbi:MAG TPA: hypothetical protein VKD28_05785 [Gemmatimonadales bacterium]|nr:hypothetical protein [Gemmatimonadales bacterium]